MKELRGTSIEDEKVRFMGREGKVEEIKEKGNDVEYEWTNWGREMRSEGI